MPRTCAAIASFQLAWRLLLATGDVRYADEMETCLFNAIAVSTSRSGTEFFSSKPLQVRSGHDDTAPRTVHPHGRVDALRGAVAIARGPVLFALEQADRPFVAKTLAYYRWANRTIGAMRVWPPVSKSWGR